MEKHHNHKYCISKKPQSGKTHLVIFGVASLMWFIFRTGTKPSRVTYPCQKAALANSSALLGLSIPLWIVSFSAKTKNVISKKGIGIMMLFLIANLVLSGGDYIGGLRFAEAANPNQELNLYLAPALTSVANASDIYVVNGREYAHINDLISLMGEKGMRFYESNIAGETQGPGGLIAHDDVVLIKINEEWDARGGTNTDILKELIQAVISHPEGFAGEIVVADNGQWGGSMNWPESNAEDHGQSTQDVVDLFSQNFNVSTYSWIPIRGRRVGEYYQGDLEDGYILYGTADPETGIYVSYPKFKTKFGTFISFKGGIWNGTGYEKRLKVINMPVLKTHSLYGVTASLKHYMGVQSQGEGQAGLANGHTRVATGGMGTLMVEAGFPTLNIIDAIWVNANPGSGPDTPYNMATRVNVLMASTDPVGLDYWSAKHVLMETAKLIGYTDTRALNPDNTVRSIGELEAFGVWLHRTESEIARGGYQVTSDETKMNVYIKSSVPPPSPTPSPTPTPTPYPTPTPTPHPTPVATPTPTPTNSPSPTSSPSASPTPNASESPEPTPEPNEGLVLPTEAFYIILVVTILISLIVAVVVLKKGLIKKK